MEANNMNPESIDRMNKAFSKFGEAMAEAAKSIVEVFGEIFSNAWLQIKEITKGLDKNISRKRFVKLLMSQGIQRNEANKIAWKVHVEKGKYTLLDYALTIKNKEE